jgi:hypothetical protein
MTDYAAIARKYGGQPSEASGPDYAALAKQYGGTPASEAPTEGRSTFGEIARQVGLTARAGIKGVTSLAALPGDALGLGTSSALDRLLTRIGLPEPASGTERFAQNVAGSMASAATGVGLGNVLSGSTAPVARGVGEIMSAGPGMQVVSGATGAAAGEAARNEGAGTWGQMAAAMAGGMLPSAGTALAQEATRRLYRGGEAGRIATADNLKAFETADIVPSAGQATGARVPQYIEGLAGKIPGGAGVLAAKGRDTAEKMGQAVTSRADALAPGASPERAGRTIETGIQGFVQRFKETKNALYDKLDDFIPQTKRIDVANTRKALVELNADIPGAPNLSELFKNAKIKNIQGALEADVNTKGSFGNPKTLREADLLKTAAEAETLPYEAIKKLRTLVGDQIENFNLTSDVPRSKWKALYGALSQDLEGAAGAAGKDAKQAFSRANAFTKAGHERIDGFLNRVARKDAPEDAFKAVTSGLDDGGTALAATMRSIKPEERKAVTAAFVKRMGQARPGSQNDTGEVFSVETFLTNWNKVSPQAKAQLFGLHSGTMRRDLEQIAKAANAVREGSRVLSNPSGTGQVVVGASLGSGAATALASGNVGTAAALLAPLPLAYGSAKLMTNPRFVRWLAKSTELSPAALPAQLNALTGIARREDEEDRAAIDDYISQISR